MSGVTQEITVENAIDRYADTVYRLALVQTKNASDADDIFQEVFIRLVKHISELQSWEHVKAWLIKVTINCSKKHFALFWNKNVFLTDEQERLTDESESYVIEEEHPVTAAVKQLPDKYRAVVHLFYYEELSVAEISRITGQKETTVKSQLFRAREMLKEMLEDDADL